MFDLKMRRNHLNCQNLLEIYLSKLMVAQFKKQNNHVVSTELHNFTGTNRSALLQKQVRNIERK